VTIARRLLTVAAALCAVRGAKAQSASIPATATVLAPLVVAGPARLAFGTDFTGVDTSARYSNATASKGP
jgi:hypothetical protein